jgi:superoxide reductase
MTGFTCKVCGFVSIDGTTPDNCPVCGAPKSSFEEKEDALKEPQDANNLTELEKKHIPVIKIVKTCGLIPEGCADVHIRIGEILHPMQPEHSIQWIDFYVDKEFVSRIKLTPEKLNPAAALHLKVQSGKLTVVDYCNLHGSWVNEDTI